MSDAKKKMHLKSQESFFDFLRTDRLGVANSVALARRRAAHRVALVAASPAAPSSVAMSGRSRLAKELKECARDPDPTIALAPDGENLFAWTATLMGPKDTPFETGTFVVKMRVPDSYPLAPPKARFATKIFHPNVHFKTGEICLDVLKDQWSPAWTLHSVCRAILALMSSPEPDSPLNCDAGNMLRARDDLAYWSMARLYSRMHAGAAEPRPDAYWPPIDPNRELDEYEKADEARLRERERADASGSGSNRRRDEATEDPGPPPAAREKGKAPMEPMEPPARGDDAGTGTGTTDPRAAAARAAAARLEAARVGMEGRE